MSAPGSTGESVDGIADTLSRWATPFSFEDIPADVVEEAKRCLLDTTGVALAGSQHSTAKLVRDQVETQYGAGSCSLLGSSNLTAPSGAAFANGVAAHALDYDDVSYEGMLHATAAVWPAVLAVAESVSATGQDVMAAFVAAVEVEYALGRAFTHDLFWRGWWTTGLLGAVGAAVGASKVMGADADTVREAICIAACQTSGPYVLVGSPIKPVACGRAAELGVQSALLASAGLTAPTDAFEHDHGLITMFGDGTFQAQELDKLGRHYVLSTSRVAFKRYPVCAGAQSGIEALLDLLRDKNPMPEEVVRIRCEVTPDVGHYMPYAKPKSVTEAQFSMPFCLACALTHRDVAVTHLDGAVLDDPLIRRRMEMVEVVLSEDLAACESARDDVHQPARITLYMQEGTEISAFNPAPTGMPVKPMTDAALDAKFMNCAGCVMTRSAAEKLRQRLRTLESLQSVKDLLRDR